MDWINGIILRLFFFARRRMFDIYFGLKLTKWILYMYKIIYKVLCYIYVYMYLDLVKVELFNDFNKKIRK